ncbi:MAG: hypothetical protein ISN28_08500, partial [Ectothiorhodospiraceae bacterium AqS1]|nr:hypothetical protein [Ectothiorhodospiraceae bacterium AqS1]
MSGKWTSGGNCVDIPSTGGDRRIPNVGYYPWQSSKLPAAVCFEYEDAASQRATGFQGCDSVIDTIDDCGDVSGGIDFVNPLSLPSGNMVLGDTGTLAIDEGGTGTFTVKLGATPTPASNVTVTITSADTGAVTVNPPSLTFTT